MGEWTPCTADAPEASAIEENILTKPTGKVTFKRTVGAVLGAAVLVAGGYELGRHTGISASSSALQNKEERLDIVPSFPACSKSGENCYATGCCQVSGHKCYTKSYGVAQCNETCTPGLKGFQCGVVGSHSVPVASKLEGKKLYCFSVYTENTGSTKKSYELELLQAQKRNGLSIFACESWDVFGDVAAAVDDSYSMIQVEDTFGEFHQIKRKTGAWVNWGLFYQVWVKVREVGKWQQGDYVVKADADAVFVPQRWREWLGSKGGDTPHGVYFENCPNVQYGFFGNLEVMSKTAASVLTTYLEDCHAVFAPCAKRVATGSSALGVRTSSCRGALITTTWTRPRAGTSPQMGLAKQTGLRARKRTRSGMHLTAPRSPHQRRTPSRSRTITSSA